MWMYFWDDSTWIPPTPPTPSDFWCALTGSSGMTGGGDIPFNLG